MEGYVCVNKGASLYAAEYWQEELGVFEDDAVVYAVVAIAADDMAESWLKIAFDTAEVKAAGGETLVGYLQFKNVTELSAEEVEQLVADLSLDPTVRSYQEKLMPVAAFAPVAAPVEEIVTVEETVDETVNAPVDDTVEETPEAPAADAVEEPEEDETVFAASEAILISKQPASVEAAEDASIKFTVTAEGEGLSYLWQYSDNDGATWKNTSSTTASYSWKLTAARNNRQVRVKITDAAGNEKISDAAVATIVAADEPITISKQPTNIEAEEDATVKFTVTAKGDGLTYLWQYSDNNGSTWKNTSGTSATYSWKLTAARNNRQVRVKIMDANGNEKISMAAKATILSDEEPITIVTQPANVEAAENATVKFTVVAEGDTLSYLWQYSDNGGTTWKNTSGTAATYSWKLTAERNNRQVRVKITDVNGNEKLSDPAVATIAAANEPIVITKQPQNVEAAEDATVKFSVTAEGEGLSYLWQYSDNGGTTWKNTSGTAATYSWKLTAARNNRQVRVKITDANGNEKISDPAVATILGANDPIVIVTQPQNVEAAEDATVRFTVVAEGEGLSYLWQYSDNNGVTWKNTSGTAATYSWKLTAARNNRQVRVKITDAAGNELTSDPAVATIAAANDPIVIVTQPQNVEAAEDATVRFTVVAEGEGLSYLWQYSDNNGVTWKNTSGTAATYSWKLTAARNNRQVRVKITDAAGNELTSDPAVATIAGDPITIVTQPVSAEAEENANVTFSVVAEGNTLAYLWQYSDDGGTTWKNTTVKTASYTWKLTAARNNRQLRVKITDAAGNELFSDAAVATIVIPSYVIDGVTYEKLGDGICALVSYDGTAASLTIPETVEGLTVVEIGVEAFMGNTALVSIDLPDTITVIRARAFKGCINLSSMS